jgi:hypothetical protein
MTHLEICPGCGAAIKFKESGKTLVGYGGYTAPHNHDDNCVKYIWQCDNGCFVVERQQNVCPVPGCDWRGKTDCFCSKLGIAVYPKIELDIRRQGGVI